MTEREGGVFLWVGGEFPQGVARDFFLRTLVIVNVNGNLLLVLIKLLSIVKICLCKFVCAAHCSGVAILY